MRLFHALPALFLCSSLLNTAQSAETPAPALPQKAEVKALIDQAQNYLLSTHEPDGSFWRYDMHKAGLSAIVLESVVDAPFGVNTDDERIVKSVAFLKTFQQPDGGIYNPEDGVSNYTTAATVTALSVLGDTDTKLITRARNYLLGLQNTTDDSLSLGGIGYGSKGAGHEDLNNTTFAIEALVKSGNIDDPAVKERLITFLQRCQNLSSHNNLPTAGNDGGAFYSPDVSKASSQPSSDADIAADNKQAEAGKLNSYGTMTYNLITSYIYLDLRPGDPRLDAALGWAKQNYRFDTNPGMGPGQERQGHYYYLNMLGKTYDLLGMTTMELPDGSTVDWRADLFNAIKKRAIADPASNGTASYWINEADRWHEGTPQLITAYMLKNLKRIYRNLDK